MIRFYKIIFIAYIILFMHQVSAADEQLQYAIQDLSSRHNLEKSEITLLKKTSMTWRSGALGCPRPNTQYTQALVPGMLYELLINEKIYRYHAKTNEMPFYCPDKFVEKTSINPADL